MWCGHQILKKKNDFLKEKKIDKNQKSITARSDVCWDKGVYVKREGRLSFSRGMCIAGGWSGLYRTRWKMHRRDPSLSSLWLDLVRHPSFLHVTCLFFHAWNANASRGGWIRNATHFELRGKKFTCLLSAAQRASQRWRVRGIFSWFRGEKINTSRSKVRPRKVECGRPLYAENISIKISQYSWIAYTHQFQMIKGRMYVRYVRAYNVTMSITHTHAHRERRVLALSTGLPSLLLLSQSATVLYQHFTRYALFRIV